MRLASLLARQRCVVSLLASLMLAAIALEGRAEGAAALEVSTTPALPTAARSGGAVVRTAQAGSVVQLRVVARAADGTALDVTGDPQTTYAALAPSVASVSTAGELRFAAQSSPQAAAVVVQHGGASALIAFDVIP